MAHPRNALGRGLDALLAPPRYAQVHDDYLLCDLGHITPDPHQPRQRFDPETLQELASSIREHGIIQPLVVRRGPTPNTYILIAGERRYRAATSLGLERVPVVIREVATDEALELALIENLQREDLGPLEEAHAYERLLERPGVTQEHVARRLGRSRSAIANTLRLLALHGDHQALLAQGTITAGHARALLSLSQREDRDVLARRITQGGLTVREAEASAKALRAPQGGGQAPKKRRHPLEPYCQGIATELSQSLDAEVQVRVRGRKGRIEIPFDGIEDLRRLRDLLTF